MRYPQRPGWKATDTSEAAAASMAPRARTLRTLAYTQICLALRGLTADEVAAKLGESVLAVRPRITELRRPSLIDDSGARRLNRSGKAAIVWAKRIHGD